MTLVDRAVDLAKQLDEYVGNVETDPEFYERLSERDLIREVEQMEAFLDDLQQEEL